MTASRPATRTDASAIAAIRYRSSAAAYRDLLPAERLFPLSVSDWTERVAGLIEEPDHLVVVAVDSDGTVLGFVCAAPSRDHDADDGTAEVQMLYVDPDRWRTGVGGMLLRAATEGLAGRGFTGATLWVLTANRPARCFYENHGWQPDQATKEHGYATEVRYRRSLAARDQPG